jgi:hypothetical protein
MFVFQQFMSYFLLPLGASFSYMFLFSSLNKASMIHTHAQTRIYVYIYIYYKHTHGCLEVALPNARGSRKKKRVNRSERMCIRGGGKYERVYIYQQKGEKIVTTISTDPMVYRLIANTSILAFIRVVGLGTFKICYFWIRLS